MSNKDCLFCKIIDGEIPSAKVYEDEQVYAFLDISQVTKGHTLVIPKEHTKNIFETPPEIASELYARVPRIANAIMDAYKPLGMNTLNNNGEAAEQSVFHLHVHLIPRYGDDTDGYSPNWTVHSNDYENDDLQRIAKEINEQIK